MTLDTICQEKEAERADQIGSFANNDGAIESERDDKKIVEGSGQAAIAKVMAADYVS